MFFSNIIIVPTVVGTAQLKTSRVYCSKRRDQTGSVQSQHSLKRDLHMVTPAYASLLIIYSFFLLGPTIVVIQKSVNARTSGREPAQQFLQIIGSAQL